MKPWLTVPEAAVLAGRSRRTIRRWITDGRIRTLEGVTGEPLLSSSDVVKTEAATTEYRRNPTRPQPKRTNPDVTDVTAVPS
jgi:hypothetical protein